jgi:hypothetical protein
MKTTMKMGKRTYRVALQPDPVTCLGHYRNIPVINLDNQWYLCNTFPDSIYYRDHPNEKGNTVDYFPTGLWLDVLEYYKRHNVKNVYLGDHSAFIPMSDWIGLLVESMTPEGAYITAHQSYIPLYDEDMDDDLAKRLRSTDSKTAIEAIKEAMCGGTMSNALKHHSKVCINAINVLKDFMANHPAVLFEEDTIEVEVYV